MMMRWTGGAFEMDGGCDETTGGTTVTKWMENRGGNETNAPD